MSQLTDFIERRIFTSSNRDSISSLDALTGTRIGDTRFDATIGEARARIEPWMPLFFLPLGESGGFHVGLHLRPSDVSSNRFAILQVQSPGAIVEVSPSFEHLIFLALAREEGASDGEEMNPEALKAVRGALGEEFYEPGGYGEFDEDQAPDIAAGMHGGSVDFFLNAAIFEEEPDLQLQHLREGMAIEPECMAFHLRAARLHERRGERPQAATVLARALKCYHHTAYDDTLDADYRLARQLLKEFPSEFSDTDRRDLGTASDKERLQWTLELYKSGNPDLATKVLCDMCHNIQDYGPVLHIFRKHFETLSWPWALALCDFREGAIR